jgi:hypothetical protein
VSRAIPANATPGVVARYMTRPPITPQRMLGEASKTQIIYRSDAVHPRHHANFRVFAPLDFLAEVSACGGRMRLIATIEDPRVIRRILAHLRLPPEGPDPYPSRPPPGATGDLFADIPA